jgi:Mce-associated membrane protein
MADAYLVAQEQQRAGQDFGRLVRVVKEFPEMPSSTTDLVDGNVDAIAAEDLTELEPGVHNAQSVRHRFSWAKLVVFGVMPIVLFAMALAAAYLKWHGTTASDSASARTESAQAAKETVVALLSYQAPTADKQLRAAAELTTGRFKDEYQDLINTVVIPGAQQQLISATAEIVAAAPVLATPDHAVVLLFVNQSTGVGSNTPTEMQSSVRVAMDKVDGHWLVSGFVPV